MGLVLVHENLKKASADLIIKLMKISRTVKELEKIGEVVKMSSNCFIDEPAGRGDEVSQARKVKKRSLRIQH